jgi:hypothetical protein
MSMSRLLSARPYCRAGLIDKSCGGERSLCSARRILQRADRRLPGQWRAIFRTAADRDLHEWIMPQPVEVDCILWPQPIAQMRAFTFEHSVLNAVRIAAIRHRIGNPSATAAIADRRLRMVAAPRSFLRLTGQVKWKRRIIGRGGSGPPADMRCNLTRQRFAT